jgi:putative tricarboxylic transport membrane protein
MLMTQHPEIFWGVIASMYVGNVMLLILNLPLISIWVQLLKIPYYILFPMIFLLCVIGSYSTNQNIFDVWVMIGFGVLGYILRKLKYETAPIILAMVLGPMFELALRQSLIMDNGNPWIFFTRPISCSILAIAIIVLGLFIFGNIKKIPPPSELE